MCVTEEQQKIYVAIWHKAVDTQMHFNEMCVKSRQFGLGFVAAALGLGTVLFTRNGEFSIPIQLFGGFNLNMTVIITFAAAVALYAVMLLDLNVYHKMLQGAVAFGEDFEQNYMQKIFVLEKGMTQAISHFSRHEDADVKTTDGKYYYSGSRIGSALSKIKKFYYFSIGTLCVVGALLFVATAHFGHMNQPQPEPVKSEIEKIQPAPQKFAIDKAESASQKLDNEKASSATQK
jgi:hypothetical protein